MAQSSDTARSGPRLNFPIFLLALVGILVVTHLWVQQRAGFAFGCTGAGDAASGAGCAEVTSSIYGDLFGVSLLVWGGLFYLAVALLRVGIAALRPPTSDTLRTVSLVLASGAFLFVLYLLSVQAFVLGQFCTLCLLSSITTAAIFALHVVEKVKGPGPATAVSTALGRYAIGAVALVVLAGADVLFLGDGAEAVASRASGGQEMTAQQIAAAGGVSAVCRYDAGSPRLDGFDGLITADTPFEGAADAPVRAMKIFDPNCPHCRSAHATLHSSILPVVGDEMQLYYQPQLLWDHSMAQIQALYLANEEGKFFDMLNLEFQNQPQFAALIRQQDTEGVVDMLVALAEQIGMDGEAFRQEIEARKYVGLIRENARIVQESGLTSVPRLVIEGRVLANTGEAWSPGCISQLVAVAAGERGEAASDDSQPEPMPVAGS